MSITADILNNLKFNYLINYVLTYGMIVKKFIKYIFMPFLAACQPDTDGENKQLWTDERGQMVDYQIIRRGITNQCVVAAMRIVPRHKFVPPEYRDFSYNDRPLPIGYNQTISQPYIVAAMTDALDLSPEDKVLEIGTGSGYQAAILAQLVSNVYSIEIVPELAERAEQTITELGYTNIHFKCGDGYQGWPGESPFDAIIVTCAPDEIPKPLIDQLADNGRIIIPVGGRYSQELVRVTRKGKELIKERLMYVIFVPMTGEAME